MSQEWKLKSIDEIAIVSRGRSKHRPRNDPALYGGSYPFVQTADIHASDLYINSFSKTYSDLGLGQSKLWQPGVLCITNAGENTGDCAILNIEACFPDSIIAVTPKPEEADVYFLKYAVDRLRNQLRSVTKGATQDNLSVSKLVSFKFQVPSFSTQKRIGAILRSYGDLIENNRRRIQLLEESARSLYKEWFVYLRFPGHEHIAIVDGIPEGWKSALIADIGEIITGKTPSKKRESYYGNDVPFIKTPDMHGSNLVIETEEKLSEEGANSQANKTLPARAILVSCIGTVGVVALNASVSQINQQINAIIPKSESLRYWAFYMAKTLKPILEGMSGGATMANINKSKFASIPIVIPNRLLLNQFSEFVEPIIDQIEQLTLINLQLQKARDLLLPRLMTGAITV